MEAPRHRRKKKTMRSDRTAKERHRSIRVIVADDHAFVRQGLISLLKTSSQIEVLGEATDGLGAVELAENLHPDVVIMDVMMPGLNGIEATRLITAKCPGVRVIGLTMCEETGCATALLAAGAVACLPKYGSTEKLMTAVLSPAPPPTEGNPHFEGNRA